MILAKASQALAQARGGVALEDIESITVRPEDWEPQPGAEGVMRVPLLLPDGKQLNYGVRHKEGDPITAEMCEEARVTLERSARRWFALRAQAAEQALKQPTEAPSPKD